MTEATFTQSTASQRGATTHRRLGLWDRVSFSFVHAMVGVMLVCMTLRGLYAFGRAFGTLEWLINYKRRRRFSRALLFILEKPPSRDERRRACRAYFMRSRCDKLFFLVLDRIGKDRALGIFSITNRELLDEAAARGKGVYIALSHHGAQHVVTMFMALCGYKVAAVRDANESGLRLFMRNRFVAKHAEYRAIRWFHADSYPREIMRALRDGYLLGSAMDVSRTRNERQKTESVVVFGQAREFLTGPLRLALKCDTPVVQAFVLPDSGFRYRLEIVGTILDPKTVADETEAVSQAVRTYAANVETYVRRYPSLISRI